MTSLWCLLLLAAPPAGAGCRVTDLPGLRITIRVRASVYTYEVTNIAHPAIRDFEVPFADGYDFAVPEGWTHSIEGKVFHAWTGREGQPIRPGTTERFSYRISSHGAVLGRVPVRMRDITSETILVADAWGTVPLPRGYTLLVAGLVLTFGLLHMALAERAGSGCAAG